MQTSFRLLVLPASLLLTLAAAGTAAAALPAATEVATQVVRFKDLDLATAAGAEALYGRIVSAARRVCREAQPTEAQTCRVRAVDVAVADIGNGLLTSIHRSATIEAEKVVRR